MLELVGPKGKLIVLEGGFPLFLKGKKAVIPLLVRSSVVTQGDLYYPPRIWGAPSLPFNNHALLIVLY